MALAIIEAGFYDESTEVVIGAAVADGTTVLLYDDIIKEQLGQSTISSGQATVILDAPLREGQRIIAYVEAYGEHTDGAMVVAAAEAQRTGWKKPVVVGPLPYDEYLANGNTPIARVYDPENCYNRAYVYEADIYAALKKKYLSFVVEVQNTVVAGAPTAVAVVRQVLDAPGGALYSFDGAAATNVNSKSYTANGNYEVRVSEAGNPDNSLTLTFDVALLSAPTPPTTQIRLVWFDPQATPDGPVLVLSAHCPLEVEFSVDGVSSFANIPGGDQAGGWVKAQTSKPNFWGRALLLPAYGNYTARVRVKTNTADQKPFDVYVN